MGIITTIDWTINPGHAMTTYAGDDYNAEAGEQSAYAVGWREARYPVPALLVDCVSDLGEWLAKEGER